MTQTTDVAQAVQAKRAQHMESPADANTGLWGAQLVPPARSRPLPGPPNLLGQALLQPVQRRALLLQRPVHVGVDGLQGRPVGRHVGLRVVPPLAKGLELRLGGREGEALAGVSSERGASSERGRY